MWLNDNIVAAGLLFPLWTGSLHIATASVDPSRQIGFATFMDCRNKTPQSMHHWLEINTCDTCPAVSCRRWHTSCFPHHLRSAMMKTIWQFVFQCKKMTMMQANERHDQNCMCQHNTKFKHVKPKSVNMTNQIRLHGCTLAAGSVHSAGR